MLKRFVNYSNFVKVEHTFFSLPLMLSGTILAAHRWPSWRLLILVIMAGLGARTAAFALNRIIDRQIDRRNPRTASRELARGAMTLMEAWIICLAGIMLYDLCAWLISPFCFYWSPIPLLIFVIYPFMKRFTMLAHFGVGLADAMAPLGGWVAVTASWHPFWPGFWLSLFTFFWVTGFDIIYATMDKDFDRAEGLHSMPARLGTPMALRVSGFLHLLAFASLGILYIRYLHFFFAGVILLIVGGLLYWEQRWADNVEFAFFKINAVLGFVVLTFITAGVFV